MPAKLTKLDFLLDMAVTGIACLTFSVTLSDFGYQVYVCFKIKLDMFQIFHGRAKTAQVFLLHAGFRSKFI